jgi:hypothetical protein
MIIVNQRILCFVSEKNPVWDLKLIFEKLKVEKIGKKLKSL